jgi:hypothetical protein
MFDISVYEFIARRRIDRIEVLARLKFRICRGFVAWMNMTTSKGTHPKVLGVLFALRLLSLLPRRSWHVPEGLTRSWPPH